MIQEYITSAVIKIILYPLYETFPKIILFKNITLHLLYKSPPAVQFYCVVVYHKKCICKFISMYHIEMKIKLNSCCLELRYEEWKQLFLNISAWKSYFVKIFANLIAICRNFFSSINSFQQKYLFQLQLLFVLILDENNNDRKKNVVHNFLQKIVRS